MGKKISNPQPPERAIKPPPPPSPPMVVNMSCEGQIQCPLCNELFSLKLFLPEECISDSFECPACLQMISIDKNTVQVGNAIANRRGFEKQINEDVNIIKRVQWHLDVPVCRILAGIKIHLTTISIKELFFLYWNLGGESIDDLALIIWQLIRLRRKHKRPLKTV